MTYVFIPIIAYFLYELYTARKIGHVITKHSIIDKPYKEKIHDMNRELGELKYLPFMSSKHRKYLMSLPI